MTYDRDIFWVRIGAWCLVAGNLVANVLNLLHHNWTVAIACFIWMYNSLLILRSTKLHQAMRDRGRVIEAGFNDILRRQMEQD